MRQSAGNFNNFISSEEILLVKKGSFPAVGGSLGGSSETTCDEYYDNDFIYWFIGFTEGDGSFIVNKNGYL